MYSSTFLLSSLLALGSTAFALPVTTTTGPSTGPTPFSQLPVSSNDAYDWRKGYVSDYTIHSSCNSTERHEINEGLKQAVLMAEHAKNHILVHGNNSAIFRKYFGKEGATATPAGWFDKVVSGNHAGIIFRCDDPDKNCVTQDKWAGHWRGSNATSETVICPLSYEIRLPITALCARGFTVANGRPANYWAPDLLHRLYHVPLIGEGLVEHHADGYAGVQRLAAGSNYTWAGSNSATLTYFATEAYAFDISIPGEGCVGKAAEVEDDGHGGGSGSASSSSATASVTATAVLTSVNPTRTVPAEASSTGGSSAPVMSPPGSDCHSHDDGTLHCV